MIIILNSFFLVSMMLWLSRSTPAPAPLYLQVDCEIYDSKGVLQKKFPDYLCLFFENGERASITMNSLSTSLKIKGRLTYYSNSGAILWKKKLEVHHELQLVHDKKKIAVLSSEFRPYKNLKLRFDVLNIYSRSGELLNRWSFADHMDEIEYILREFNFVFKFKSFKFPTNYNDHLEFTHVNSFKEIPPNSSYPQLDYLKPGNFIVGVNCLNLFFILDSNLTRIVKALPYGNNQQACGTHDAQVLPNGNIIHYANFVNNQPPFFSRLEEFDPRMNKVVWHWPAKNSVSFFNSFLGSIQRLDNGHTIFTDKVAIREISQLKKGIPPEVVELNKEGHVVKILKFKSSDLNGIYRVRQLDLESYLKNSF